MAITHLLILADEMSRSTGQSSLSLVLPSSGQEWQLHI